MLGSLAQDLESCRRKQHAKGKRKSRKGSTTEISTKKTEKEQDKKRKIDRFKTSRSPATAEVQAAFVAGRSSEERHCYLVSAAAAAAVGRTTERTDGRQPAAEESKRKEDKVEETQNTLSDGR